MKKIIICSNKYKVEAKDYMRVRVTSKTGGFIESKDVNSLLLLEIVSLLKEINNAKKEN